MENKEEKVNTKEELKFSYIFKKDGKSFQEIIEQILLNKINAK